MPRDPEQPELAVTQGDNPAQLVQQAMDKLGGVRRFVARGDIVLVKPNIGWDRTPEQAANTNPLVVAEIIRQCWSAGAKKVIVTDVSCNEPRRLFSGDRALRMQPSAKERKSSYPNPQNLRMSICKAKFCMTGRSSSRS